MNIKLFPYWHRTTKYHHKILINHPKSPYLSTFSHHPTIISPPSIQTSKIFRKRPFLGIISNSTHIFHKSHPISRLITSNHIAQNKKNPLKIKDSYYSPAYPDPILPNIILFNHNFAILLLNSPIIVDFLCKFNFLSITHRTNHRVYFYSFPQKKKP